ncbi:M56 family metallopeptidase [Streptomyces sp. NPDC049627]|uniref:M56 family metallopeptidase n=1 Tax=Streptomyces sp. NPDC049627 TaxID=3365595 RepID=UPI0037BAFE39
MNNGENRRTAGKGTTRRFLVLLFVLLSSCLTMLNRAALALESESTFRTCARVAGADPDAPVWRVTLSIWFDEDFEDCRVQAAAEALRLALLGTGAVVLVALVVYWLIPVRRIRRGRLLPAADFDGPPAPAQSGPRESDAILAPTEDGWFDLRTRMERVAREAAAWRPRRTERPDEPLSRHLAALTERAEVTRAPRFMVDMRPAKASTAVAFGRAGRYLVALPAALLKDRTHNPRTLEAVVLHELAHIRNRDVDITYLTVALWRTYCVLVLLPYAVLQGWLVLQATALGRDRVYWADATPWLGEVLFAAFLVAQVQLSRADVLRSRELCADLDAVASGADPAVWEEHARARQTGRLPGWAASAVDWFTGLWRTHPDWAHRHTTVTRSAPSDPGGSWLQAVLFFTSLAVLLRVPIAESRSWAEELLHAAIYVAVPLLVATWFAVRPPKAGTRDRTGGWAGGVPKKPKPARQPRPRRTAVLLALSIGALLVLDPLSADPPAGSADSLSRTLDRFEELPSEYRPERMPSPDGETGARVTAWAEGGGRDAVTGLIRALALRPSGVEDMADNGPDRYEPSVPDGYCAAVRKALSAAEAQPRYPEPQGRESWETALKNARGGSGILCAPDVAEAEPERLFALEMQLLTAKTALETLILKLAHFTGDPPPTDLPAPSTL